MSNITVLPLFRLIIVYISGLLLAMCYPEHLLITLMLLLGLIILYLALYIKYNASTSTWLNGIGVLIIFLTGYSNLLLQVQQKTKLPKWVEDDQYLKGYRVCIQKVYHRLSCKALITHVRDDSGWYNNNTFIQLYFAKQSSYKPKRADSLLIIGTPVRIVSPDQIQATEHIRSLRSPCMHRHFLKQIDRDFTLLFAERLDGSRKWATMITQWCSEVLQKQLQNEQCIALISTLLWGEKEGLNLDLQKAYADTGTIHVLAISGLHVGMFYLLVYAMFRLIVRKIRFLILPDLLTLISIWLYAWICDFSPPILRATIMITMSRLGVLIGRGSNSYNGLLVSAFALLLWKPSLLFNCGFQLSYLATLGILYLQPYIHRLIGVQSYWLNKIWTATTLSIAAQMGTLPLILYYFKQFPLYFIIANWLVVPAIFLILMLSLGLVVSSHLPIVNKILSFILENLILSTNAWVCWIAKWPMNNLSIHFINGYYATLLYIVFISIYLFLKHKHLVYPIIISLCTIFYSIDQIQVIVAEQKQCQMICYNNHNLSFTLKDGIESLQWDTPPSNRNLIRHYTGGTIATWHKKVILTINTIPADWYRCHGTKLYVDYLLVNERLINDIAIIFKVLKIKTLVIYSTKAYASPYLPCIQKLGIEIIWLKPDEEKTLTWSKNL